MKIYTSYIGNWRNFPEDFEVFMITRSIPAWVEFKQAPELAPNKFLFDRFKYGNMTQEEFSKQYRSQLNSMSLQQIIKELSNGRNIILACYEKPEDFCHRHILSEELVKLGYNVEELNN